MFPIMTLSNWPTGDRHIAEPAALLAVHLGRLTFELNDLSAWCLGQSFETHLTGQCQTNTTTP